MIRDSTDIPNYLSLNAPCESHSCPLQEDSETVTDGAATSQPVTPTLTPPQGDTATVAADTSTSPTTLTPPRVQGKGDTLTAAYCSDALLW